MSDRHHTRSRIARAAWELFRRKGYQETTISDIIAAAGTSRGTFYHYFTGKDELLSTLSYMFDDFYREQLPLLDPDMDSCDKLIYLSCACHKYISETIPLELLAQLYSSQVVTSGDKNLLDRNRFYYEAVQGIIDEGQRRGQIDPEIASFDAVHYYAMCERAIIYDWCIAGGSYDLAAFTAANLRRLLQGLRA
ncbi:MAG: TetR/AcrR family transcriptional regulator [Firmicutes bacterium]|nr:TetR/AcrR family transcriptional regulator [Bacillota bacterium]